MIVFVIGPGGVGKSTTGKVLAERMGFAFIDLDQEFCDLIEIIGPFIREYGYEKYCRENSKLFYALLEGVNTDTIFVLSSGFLVHEGLDEIVFRHEQTLKEKGVSVLLLPSKSIEESTEIVVARQLKRGFGLVEEDERRKFQARYPRYLKTGDIQIFSHRKPVEIAQLMEAALVDRGIERR